MKNNETPFEMYIQKLGNSPITVSSISQEIIKQLGIYSDKENELFDDDAKNSNLKKKINRDLEIIEKYVNQVESKTAKHGNTRKTKLYYDMIIKSATLNEKIACSQKNLNERFKSLKRTDKFVDIILKDLVPEEVNSILEDYETKKSVSEEEMKELSDKMNDNIKGENYNECLQALYLKELNKLATIIKENPDKKNIKQQTKRIHLITECDKKNILDTDLMFDTIVGPNFNSVLDIIRVNEGENSKEKFNQLLENENVTELAREIFPKEILGENVINPNPKPQPDSKNKKECPTPIQRLSFIKRMFGIQNIFIPKRDNDDLRKEFANLDGTYIIETNVPGIVIMESFYQRDGKGKIKESEGKATYVLSKEFSDKIITEGTGRRQTRNKAKNNKENFQIVAHTKKYFDNLQKKYNIVYGNCKEKIAAKVFNEIIEERNLRGQLTYSLDEIMSARTEAYRQAVAVLGKNKRTEPSTGKQLSSQSTQKEQHISSNLQGQESHSDQDDSSER